MITEKQRQELIDEIEANDMVAPEQVADMVLLAAEKGGYDAGVAMLAKCIENDKAEAKRLGVEE